MVKIMKKLVYRLVLPLFILGVGNKGCFACAGIIEGENDIPQNNPRPYMSSSIQEVRPLNNALFRSLTRRVRNNLSIEREDPDITVVAEQDRNFLYIYSDRSLYNLSQDFLQLVYLP